MSVSTLYWLMILPNFADTLQATGVIITGLSIIFLIFNFLQSNYAEDMSDRAATEDDKKMHLRMLTQSKALIGKSFKVGLTALTTVALLELVPSTKIMALLIGWEFGSQIEGLSELPADIVDYIRRIIAKQAN